MARFSITPKKSNVAAVADDKADALKLAVAAITPANRPGEFGTVVSEVTAPKSVEAMISLPTGERSPYLELADKAEVVSVTPDEKPAAVSAKADVAAHGERKHHRKSPSTLQLREVCMGWETRNEANEAAAAGTLQHEAADSGDLSELNDEQALAVIACNEYIDQIVASFGEGCIVLKEDYLTVDKEETTAGYLDRGILSPDRKDVFVVDFKFGQNLVEIAKNNLQGIAYGLGVYYKYPSIERIHVHFLLPHIGEGGVIDSHTFNREEFAHLLLRIRSVVDKSKYADEIFARAEKAASWQEKQEILSGLDLRPTDGGCLFCARRAVCPKINQFAIEQSAKYGPLKIPDLINPAFITDPEDCAKALKFFAVMEGLAKDYRAAASNKALNSESWMPAGYFLTSVSRRSIVDKVKFLAALKGRGLTADQITECTTFTFGPVEKLVSAMAPRGEKEAAVEAFAAELEAAGAVQKGEPFPVLKMAKATSHKLTP